MKIPAFFLTLAAAALVLSSTVGAAPIFHYKATALFPIQTEEDDPKNTDPSATIVKKVSLGSKQIINMALGQPLDTKIGSYIVLAVALNHDDPGSAKLVVYDSKALTELATVFTLLTTPTTNEATKDGDKGTGNGLSTGRFRTTTLGAPAQDGFQQTDLCCSATGGLTPTPVGPTFKMSVTGMIGPFLGNIAGVSVDGLIIKGMFTASGKPIDHF